MIAVFRGFIEKCPVTFEAAVERIVGFERGSIDIIVGAVLYPLCLRKDCREVG